MIDQTLASHGMHMLDGVLVAQAPDSIEDDALRRFQAGLLTRVHTSCPRGVLIDVSRVRLLDSTSFALLAEAGRMASMLGARIVFVGFQPGVVSTLMDLNVDTGALTTALDLEQGMDLLRPHLLPGRQEEPEEAQDADQAKAQDAQDEGVATASPGEQAT